MTGLIFQENATPAVSAPNRADIACFVGFVPRRKDTTGAFTPLPAALATWLREQGWTDGPYARPNPKSLQDVPIPIESWNVFDALFAWETRPLYDTTSGGTNDTGGTASVQTQDLPATYLGAAVRSFFAQGGRKCYLVRVGDPWPLFADLNTRQSALAQMLPGYPYGLDGRPADRAGWRGVTHLFGLPDVSFLSLPDLADAVRSPRIVIDTAISLPDPLEQFVTCSDGETAPPADDAAHLIEAPRCDAQGYERWAQIIRSLADMLAGKAREVQLVASLPLPDPGANLAGSASSLSLAGSAGREADLPAFLTRGDSGALSYPPYARINGIASAFVQLAYPWPRTALASILPEGLECPEGVLIGALAHSALTQGSFRSVAGQPLGDVWDVFPMLGHDAMQRLRPDTQSETSKAHAFIERVSLLGMEPEGLRLLSDVTTSLDENYRPACVNRLVSSLVKAARRCGEEIVFEVSGDALWARIRDRLNRLLSDFLSVGALQGATPRDAYQVRCGRSTMTQQDIDSGRVIVEVVFNAAAPIEQMIVTLALNSGGQLAVVSGGSI